MDGALLDRLSWGASPSTATSPNAPPSSRLVSPETLVPSRTASPEAPLSSRPNSPKAPSPTVHDSISTRFSPSSEIVALIVAGLHSGAALVMATPEIEEHNLSVIATRPKDKSQEQKLKKLALAVVRHESIYGLRGYAVTTGSAFGSHPLEVCKANMVDVYSDGAEISETLSLCFESMTHKLAYLVQVDHNNDDFQKELGGDIGLLAKLMIFPFRVALEVQYRKRFSSDVPVQSLQTLAIRSLSFRGVEDLKLLVATTQENQPAVRTAETFATQLIRELGEEAAVIKSAEPEERAGKRTRNQRRRGRHSTSKRVAAGEDPDKTAASTSPETASASLEPHLTTTTGTPASPTEAASSQSLEHTHTEDFPSPRTVLSPAQKLIDEDTETSQGHSRVIPSVAESSKPISSPSVLASPKMSDKSAITSPPTSQIRVATPLTPSGRRVSSPGTTTSSDAQTSGSKKLGTFPVHTPSPVQSKTESIQLWKALRQSESPSLGSPGSAERQKSLRSPSLEEEEKMSPATPRRKSSALGKESVTSLKDAESDDEWDGMSEGPEVWQVVEAKQKRKNAKQSESGHQRNISKAKSISENSEGKRDTPWANKRDLIPRGPPPSPPTHREPKGQPKKTGDAPLAPNIGEENFPALPAPSVGPRPKLEAKTKTSSAPVGSSASAQPKDEVKIYVPVVPLVSPVAPQRKNEAETQIPAAPAPSPRAPSPMIEVKEQTSIVLIPEVKVLSCTEATPSPVGHIHEEEALNASSQPLGEPSGRLMGIPEESIMDPSLLEKPLNTTGSSSQDKGKSKELIIDNYSFSSQLPSHLQTGLHPSSSDEQSLTTKHKKKKYKKNMNRRSQNFQGDLESQEMSDPKSTTAAGFDHCSSLPDNSVATGFDPHSVLPDSSAAAAAFCPGYLPHMSGISYYQVDMGPPVTLPVRPDPLRQNLYLPAQTVPSWLGAPMVFNAAEPGPLPQTFSLTTGRAMVGPQMDMIAHLGPAGAAAVTAAAAAGTPVGFVPRNPNERLPSTVPNKPAHFVYRLDSTGWECAKESCEKRTNDWDGYSMICQQCGPNSHIRYCSTEHVLEDAGTHHHICPVEPFRAPAVELPSRFEKMLPTIQNVNPPTHTLRTRQVVFNATNDAGGYAIFTDYIDWKKDGTPENMAHRANNAIGNVWHAVTFEEQPHNMDRFNRVLHAIFFDEQANGAAIVYLGRMIRQNLKERGLWNDETQNQLQYQFMGEFKFSMLNDIFAASSRNNCFAEWTGHSARYCPDEDCRRELCNPGSPYGDQTYGRGIQQHVEAMEAYHWILRAWRVFHPTVKNANDRIKGLGFPGLPDNQIGKLRGRGEGWDGYGNVGDERRI